MVLDVWPCQNPSRLIRKRPWVQTASNISLYFWFPGLIHKNTLVFYWSNNVCCCIANNNPSLPGSLAGNSTRGQDSSLAEERDRGPVLQLEKCTEDDKLRLGSRDTRVNKLVSHWACGWMWLGHSVTVELEGRGLVKVLCKIGSKRIDVNTL